MVMPSSLITDIVNPGHWWILISILSNHQLPILLLDPKNGTYVKHVRWCWCSAQAQGEDRQKDLGSASILRFTWAGHLTSLLHAWQMLLLAQAAKPLACFSRYLQSPFLLLFHLIMDDTPAKWISCGILVVFWEWAVRCRGKEINQIYIQVLALPFLRCMISVPLSLKGKWKNNICLSRPSWTSTQDNTCERV